MRPLYLVSFVLPGLIDPGESDGAAKIYVAAHLKGLPVRNEMSNRDGCEKVPRQGD
jgi:hypothetical protein